jgi:cytochrome P450
MTCTFRNKADTEGLTKDIEAPPATGWDSSRFPEPDVLDLARRPNPHLTFGHGAHACPGQHLARLVLETVLSTLLDRMPTLRPAVAVDQIDFTTRATTRGPVTLPVVWDAVRDRSPGHNE